MMTRRDMVTTGALGALAVGSVRFLRAQQKFPDYCEIGTAIFHELYDWHVRNNQPIQITRYPFDRA